MFRRPLPTRLRPRPGLAPAATPPLAPPEEPERLLRGARVDSTVVTAFGIFLTAITVPAAVLPSTMARHAAIGTGISLLAGALMDVRDGLRNLLRADLLALAALYFLSLLEFLFPQPFFDNQVNAASTLGGLHVLWVAFLGMLIGRHLWRPKQQPFGAMLTQPIAPGKLISLFWICALLGYAHMLIAVKFNLVDMVNAMMGPRFTQPWARGRLGDWKALLSELALLIQLLPPITALVLAHRERYRTYQRLPVVLVTLFTFFYAFSSGTRNLFASYLVTFALAFGLALPEKKRFWLIPTLGLCALMMLGATWMMLQFRNTGFKNWTQGVNVSYGESRKTLAVDYNLIAIARLADYFPDKHDFLGSEIVWMAIVRPIPRALWPGKPVDMTVTIEDIFGMSGLTISTTYAGEAYMEGGFPAVVIFSLFFGVMTGWWNALASPRNSELGILVYASGFFAAVITMRSSFEFTTAILPTVAGLLLVQLVVTSARAGVRRLAALALRTPQPLPARPGPMGPMAQRRGLAGQAPREATPVEATPVEAAPQVTAPRRPGPRRTILPPPAA